MNRVMSETRHVLFRNDSLQSFQTCTRTHDMSRFEETRHICSQTLHDM